MNLTKSTGNLNSQTRCIYTGGKLTSVTPKKHFILVFSIIAWIERDEIIVITFNLISQSLSAEGESHVLSLIIRSFPRAIMTRCIEISILANSFLLMPQGQGHQNNSAQFLWACTA